MKLKDDKIGMSLGREIKNEIGKTIDLYLAPSKAIAGAFRTAVGSFGAKRVRPGVSSEPKLKTLGKVGNVKIVTTSKAMLQPDFLRDQSYHVIITDKSGKIIQED